MMDGTLVAAMQSLAAQMALFQALLLGVSALHKAAGWMRSVGVVRRFAGVPRSLAPATLGAIVAAELAAGALLIVPSRRAMGATLSALIWSVYLALILRAIVQGRREVDCGCSFGSASRPLGSFQVARNAVLAGLAMLTAAVSYCSGGVAAEASQVLGGVALLALYGALDQVMAVQPLRRGEVL